MKDYPEETLRPTQYSAHMHANTRSSLLLGFAASLQPSMNKILFPLVQLSQVHTFLDVHSHTNRLTRHPSTQCLPTPQVLKEKGLFFSWTLIQIPNLYKYRSLASPRGEGGTCCTKQHLRSLCSRPSFNTDHSLNFQNCENEGSAQHPLLSHRISRQNGNDTTTQCLYSLTTCKRLGRLRNFIYNCNNMPRSELLSRKRRQSSLSQACFF